MDGSTSSTFPFFAPSTPPTARSPPSAYSLTSPEASGSSALRTPARKDGVSRQRSVRTERRRDKFAKVLRGRTEDGGAVDLGMRAVFEKC